MDETLLNLVQSLIAYVHLLLLTTCESVGLALDGSEKLENTGLVCHILDGGLLLVDELVPLANKAIRGRRHHTCTCRDPP